jgi:hypothetical protein
MKGFLRLGEVVSVSCMLALSACSTQEGMAPKPAAKPAAPAPAPEAKAAPAEKAKATKIAGDIGLLDTEKNYMIIVTKEGKLVTIDFDTKAQAVQRTPHTAKVSAIGLGSSATVQYTKQGDKNVATSIEYLPAKGE